MNYDFVIIIGAPRSGTNMLRDAMCSLSGVTTWPCDEINYIWRHGNARYPSDQFSIDMARPEVTRFIRKKFKAFANKNGGDTLIEKTCANSLRVSFVNEVFPNAKFVFIVRDGIDAAWSASQQWRAGLSIPYLLRKARYIPITDLPYYSVKYGWNQIQRLLNKDRRVSSWGPLTPNVKKRLGTLPLHEVCAMQWMSCIENSEQCLSLVNSDRIHRVQYEEFVTSPIKEFAELAAFLGKETSDFTDEYLKNKIGDQSVGKGREMFNQTEIKKLQTILGDTLKRYGYG